MRFAAFTFSVLIGLAAALQAAEPPLIELKLHPQAIESPALKHRLFPAETELKEGNAVPILLRLPWEQTIWMNKVFPTLHEWEARPLDAPEWETAGGVLPAHFYSEMKRAAFRREAEWEYPIGETQSLYLILLPDVQGLRGFLNHGLSAKIRYHLSRGELDTAREGILVGLANGRHVAQTPFFVNQLVALTIHRSMLDRTAELIAQPKSPNLYWALSTLPDLVELERAASLEGSAFAVSLPAVHDLDRPRDAAEWHKMARQLVEVLEQLQEIPPLPKPKQDASLVDQFLERLSAVNVIQRTKFVNHARAELPTLLKIPEEKVAEMSDEEAAIRWYVHLRLARDQQVAAVLSLPPREAWPLLKRMQADSRAMKEKTGGEGPDFLNPTNMYLSAWSLQRKIQSLRIIEAVRHHLASHDELPRSLSEITDVPIPRDALTDLDFEWQVEGNTATLKSPPLPADVIESASESARYYRLEYRLKFERGKSGN
jgi:hypothetical protein